MKISNHAHLATVQMFIAETVKWKLYSLERYVMKVRNSVARIKICHRLTLGAEANELSDAEEITTFRNGRIEIMPCIYNQWLSLEISMVPGLKSRY